MSQPSGGSSGQILGPLAALGLGALAVACCIGLPFLITAAGGLALAAILGGGAGLAGATLLLAAIVVARRHRRSREVTPSPEPSR